MAFVDNDLANLSLDEEEDEGFQFAVEEGPQQPLYDLCLVGCALTASVVNFLAMKNTMANLWHPLGGIQIFELGEKRYMFRFFYEVDLKRERSSKKKEKGVIWQSDKEREDMVKDMEEIPLENKEGKKRFRLESHIVVNGQGERRGTHYKNKISAAANRQANRT
ncbi:hypothetical protein Gotri_026827 [Gossypium trilobum]|uniref:DUF4283 domain-containing protein n=1 Tax=Gossypium trilobum TaxID=34281 RepID=A0A7J9FJ80_9ROSI|nr:hypothetical protein [Gossypium trilobum]